MIAAASLLIQFLLNMMLTRRWHTKRQSIRLSNIPPNRILKYWSNSRSLQLHLRVTSSKIRAEMECSYYIVEKNLWWWDLIGLPTSFHWCGTMMNLRVLWEETFCMVLKERSQACLGNREYPQLLQLEEEMIFLAHFSTRELIYQLAI